MDIEKVSIDELISPDYNPREISFKEMEKLKTSIIEFGYVDPLIVNRVNNHIVGGNQRYDALKDLGYTTVDVVYIEEDDINREKALNIALNKISGDWDTVKLNNIFEDMRLDGFDDIDLTGFEEYELNDLDILDMGDDFELSDDGLSDGNEKSNEVTCPYCNKTFDV